MSKDFVQGSTSESAPLPAPTTTSSLSVVGLLGSALIAAILFATEWPGWSWMYHIWTTHPDNSHGLLVPFFSIFMLWHRRNKRPASGSTVSPTAIALGAFCIVTGLAVACFGIFTRSITVEVLSILPTVTGVVLCLGGWKAARWAWPSVAFLVFMIPLPRAIGTQLGGSLQKFATICSTYLMQLVGLPAVADGNVIYLTHATLGVAEACSGIRMLMSFFAITTAICLTIDRALWEKCLIWLTAPLIALISNVLRITATGLAYEYGSEQLADMIFHDLAGWLMMPLALFLLWLEILILDRLFPLVEVETGPTRIIRATAPPAAFRKSSAK